MTLGEKIKNIRIQKNLSQEKFANILEINRNHLSRIENNKSEPDATLLKKICIKFTIDINYLLDINSNKNENAKNFNELFNSLSQEDLNFIIKIAKILKEKNMQTTHKI